MNNSFENLLITGGTGFFGRAILKFLIHNTNEFSFQSITILSRNPDKFLANLTFDISLLKVDFIKIDLTSKELSHVDLSSYSHIIHAATESTLGPEIKPKDRFLDIIKGSEHILGAIKSGRSPRFLLVSSGSVYGQPMTDSQGFSEIDPVKLNTSWVENAYSVGKIFSEHLAYQYNNTGHIDLMVARCFSFVGEDLPLDKHFAIGNFINSIVLERPIIVSGNGNPIRSYLHQTDLAKWLLKILCYGKKGEIFNVGSDELVSIKELAYLIQDISENKSKVLIQGRVDASQSSVRNLYYPDITKGKKDLGLKVETKLIDSILKTIEYHKNT